MSEPVIYQARPDIEILSLNLYFSSTKWSGSSSCSVRIPALGDLDIKDGELLSKETKQAIERDIRAAVLKRMGVSS